MDFSPLGSGTKGCFYRVVENKLQHIIMKYFVEGRKERGWQKECKNKSFFFFFFLNQIKSCVRAIFFCPMYFHSVIAMWPWTTYLLSLCLRFSILKWWQYFPNTVLVRDKWTNMPKKLNTSWCTVDFQWMLAIPILPTTSSSLSWPMSL